MGLYEEFALQDVSLNCALGSLQCVIAWLGNIIIIPYLSTDWENMPLRTINTLDNRLLWQVLYNGRVMSHLNTL